MQKPIDINKEWQEKITSLRDMVLGNLVMVSQITASTFKERNRSEFVLQRFKEVGLSKAYIDESDNVIGVLKGRNSSRRVVLSANLDTRFEDDVDHNVTMDFNQAKGAGIANNSLGVAALISLPDIIKRLDIQFDMDIVFAATTRAHGRGDLDGMRHFINTYPFKIDFVLNIMATNIGRVDHFCQSAVRGDVTCVVEAPEEFTSTGFEQNNAIIVLNELINSLLCIPMSNRPKISLNIGKTRGGESYSTPCPEATLNLYVRSEDDNMTEKVIESIKDCCIDIGSKNGVRLDVSFFGRYRAAGLRFSHPLVKTAIKIVRTLGFRPMVAPSNTQIAIPLSKEIPSITMGVTTGKQSSLPNDYVLLEDIPDGILQLITLINEIDKGHCDE
ncbi:MAG: M20/M25/M40 family metallo-hydrolase [Fibrobacteria bacterium]|nr:M20/M25/M40 family metallo-hydrolase [Fibrobacteria bacterium]